MEASFKSRVERTFGALLGSSLPGLSASQLVSVACSSSAGDANVSSQSWSVSEVAIPCSRASKCGDENSGSEADVPCAARYEKFVQLVNRGRKRQAAKDDEGLSEENDLDEDRVGKRRRSGESDDKVSVENGKQDLDEDEECRQIRLMVGMDDTLDFEEEEDEYDKVAVGREGAGERMYMREITGAVAGISPLSPLPVIEGRQIERDSRANHAAAAARLQEDDRLAVIENAEVTRMLSMSRTSLNSDNNTGMDVGSHSGMSKGLMSNVKSALKSAAGVVGSENSEAENSKFPNFFNEGSSSNGIAHENAMQENRDGKSFLEQGGIGVTQAKLKKVRFAEDDYAIQEKESVSRREVEYVSAVPVTRSCGRVPDYVCNPSKYTHYTLEWSDDEEDSNNIKAFQATRAMIHAPEKEEVMMGMVDLPQSIPFTPRSGGGTKKKGVAKPGTDIGSPQSQALVSFAEEIVVNNRPYPEENSHSTLPVKASVDTKTPRIFRKRARDIENDDTSEENVSYLLASGKK